jgi:hypothetical protein
LDERNADAFLQTGDLLCLVGDPRRLQATLVVRQADIELLRAGQPVRMQVATRTGMFLQGSISELSEINLETAPRELQAAGLLPTRTDSQGQTRPIRTCYLAHVTIQDNQVPVPLGSTGWAKVRVAPRSLAWRCMRYVRGTVRLVL